MCVCVCVCVHPLSFLFDNVLLLASSDGNREERLVSDLIDIETLKVSQLDRLSLSDHRGTGVICLTS